MVIAVWSLCLNIKILKLLFSGHSAANNGKSIFFDTAEKLYIKPGSDPFRLFACIGFHEPCCASQDKTKRLCQPIQKFS